MSLDSPGRSHPLDVRASDRTPPSDLAQRRLAEALALLLWEQEAVRAAVAEPFRLASGNHSPIYVNCRRAVSDPIFMQLFGAAARLQLQRQDVRFDVVAGGETAGIPYAAFLASDLALPMIYIRKKPKGYGTGSQIEGYLPAGSRVLLVEDLITDGGSKFVFLDAIEAAGCQVTDALVLFDRQQGGADRLAERGVRLHAAVDRETALAVAEEADLLTSEARRSIDAYFADPAGWHRERGLDFSG